jgi:hypothetical protein
MGFGRCPNGHKGSIEYDEGTGSPMRVTLGARMNSSRAVRNALLFSNPGGWGVLLSPNGRAVLSLPKITEFREDSSFKCAQCNGEWTVFIHDTSVVVIGLTNIRRTAVSMGHDDSVRDNRTGTETMIATIKVTRRWLQKVEISWEEAKATSTTERIQLSFKYAGTEVEHRIEQSLKSNLSLSSETEQVLEQTLQVPIPARSRLTIRMHWKQIWQEGEIAVQFSDGATVQIPYRAAVDLAFDQENIPG